MRLKSARELNGQDREKFNKLNAAHKQLRDAFEKNKAAVERLTTELDHNKQLTEKTSCVRMLF
jgi:ribosomal protein S17E